MPDCREVGPLLDDGLEACAEEALLATPAGAEERDEPPALDDRPEPGDVALLADCALDAGRAELLLTAAALEARTDAGLEGKPDREEPRMVDAALPADCTLEDGGAELLLGTEAFETVADAKPEDASG